MAAYVYAAVVLLVFYFAFSLAEMIAVGFASFVIVDSSRDS